MAEISMSLRWVDPDDWPFVVLYKHLMDEYLKEFDDPPLFVNRAIGKAADQHEDDGWDSIMISILPIDSMPPFREWCLERNVTVHIKKKAIATDKIWWPILIEILADHDNEHLVWCKLST